MTLNSRRKPEDVYRDVMGKDPPAPDTEHPLAWQWDFRGSKNERDQLRDELFHDDEEKPLPEIHPEQTDLFGDAA